VVKSSPRAPLWLRRTVGPLLFLSLASAVVFTTRALGRALSYGGKDYGLFLVGLAALFVLVRLINYLSFDVLFRLRRGAEAPALLREIAGLALFFAGLAILFHSILSVRLTGVLATSALITAVLGFALQDTLGNLFAGLALHLERSLQVGDMVKVGEVVGTVEELSWRAVNVRTMVGSRLLVPNNVAAREKLEVFPKSGRPIGQILRLSLEYSVSPQRVMELLESTVATVRGVVVEPAPVVFVHAFAEYAVQYEIRYWLEDYARYLEVDSDVRERVWYALGREGLAIPFPTSLRYQYQRPWETAAEPAEFRGDHLDSVEILAPLSPEERGKLRSRLKHVVFAPGENVFRQGMPAHSLYVVERGELAVLVSSEGGEVEVGSLSAGDAFGEMALLTGEPRSATVRARTESTLDRIDKDAFASVLSANPGLMREISRLVENRRERSHDALERARGREAGPAAGSDSLLSRIARYFGIDEASV
jgi:small-conductance mechanosensitive channel/CRP-like cAMP-binding protein